MKQSKMCREIDARIISGAPLSADAAAHIAGCDRCRSLVEAMDAAAPAMSPSSQQIQEIERKVLADLKPVKPLVSTTALWFACVAALATVVAIGAMMLGDAGWLALGPWQRIAVFTGLAVAMCLLASSVIRQIVPGSRFAIAPGPLAAGVAPVMILVFAILFRPREEPTFVATGLVCLRIGIECAIPAALGSWLILRRGAILNPLLTGASVGTLAGLSGLAVLEIFCPNLNRNHILTWHVGALILSAAGGAAIGCIAELRGATRRL